MKFIRAYYEVHGVSGRRSYEVPVARENVWELEGKLKALLDDYATGRPEELWEPPTSTTQDPYPVCIPCAEGFLSDKVHTCTIPKPAEKARQDSCTDCGFKAGHDRRCPKHDAYVTQQVNPEPGYHRYKPDLDGYCLTCGSGTCADEEMRLLREKAHEDNSDG